MEYFQELVMKVGDQGHLITLAYLLLITKKFFAGELNGKLICSTYFVEFGYDYM